MTPRATLKNWFKRGLKPLEIQFAEWLDSYWHKEDAVPVSSIDGLTDVLNGYASTASVNGLNTTKEDKANKGAANGYASLDAGGKVPSAQIPEIHFRGKFTTLSALTSAISTANDGDYAIVDSGSGNQAKQYIWDAEDGWVLSSGGGGVTSFASRTGAVNPASGDYTVSQITGAAPLASPAFTGTPTAPTQTAGDNSTKIATTAYVDGGLSGKQNSLGFTPENVANKDTDGTLSANSDAKYPSQKAVKTYADTKQSALGFTPENIANKATDFSVLNNTKYPTTQAVEQEIYVNIYFSQTPTF